MQAAVLKEFKTPLAIEETPDPPEPGPNEVAVEIKAAGLCFTDVKIVDGTLPDLLKPELPHVPGHEGAGVVAACGPGVTRVKPGDRVALCHSVACGRCQWCARGEENLCDRLSQIGVHRPGCFAERIVVPESNVALIDDSVSFLQAAIISDAIATPVHALRHQGELQAGDAVMIIGAGGLGLHAVQLARISDCKVIVLDVVPEKLELALEAGADAVVDVSQTPVDKLRQKLPGVAGVDLVVDFVGRESSVEAAKQVIVKGGRYVLVGYQPGAELRVDIPDLVLRQITVRGSRAATLTAFRTAVELVNAGLIRPMISDVVPFDQINEGLDLLRRGGALSRVGLKF